MLSEEEVNEQLELLRTYRRTLATYLRQQAAIGESFSPPALLYGIAETRSHIKRIKDVLGAAGVAVPAHIDDEEPPSPTLAPPRSANRRASVLLTAAGAALLIVAGLALGMYGSPLLQRPSPAATSGATAAVAGQVATAPEPAQPTAAAALIQHYTFGDGTPQGWSGSADHWRVLSDGATFVYQARTTDAESATTPPISEQLVNLSNYAIQVRIKIIQAAPPHSDLPDVWLSLRAPLAAEVGDGCDSYNFMLSQADRHAVIYRAGTNAGCEQPLFQGQVNLALGQWYELRAEVDGAQLRFLVDGALVAQTSDTSLTRGFFYFNVGPNATVQFADVRVYQL